MELGLAVGCTIFSKCSQIKPMFLHSMSIGEIRSHAKYQATTLCESINDRTYRIIHIGLCLYLLIFCQTKSDSQHRFTIHPLSLFFSDM